MFDVKTIASEENVFRVCVDEFNEFIVNGVDGDRIRVLTFSRKLAPKVYIENKTASLCFMADCDYYVEDNSIKLLSTERKSVRLLLWHDYNLFVNGLEQKPLRKSGSFNEYIIPFNIQTSPQPELKQTVFGEWQIRVSPSLLEQSDEGYLEVDYEGDAIELLVNGYLMTDDFLHGEKFVVALKRYLERLKKNEGIMTLRVKPLCKESDIYFECELPDLSNGAVANVKNVSVKFEKEIKAEWRKR